ncbi:antibiotic biosynthesis monooxygenase [Corynebacterium sp. USCH3]|uniref:antibiotic biosynthesis monooxygenase family protein n=1 Tax=Corynebacterium sp. USCH3 TaxID=3024840 RepID=UPI0030A6028C
MSVVKINAITVPEGAGPELEKRFAARAHTVDNSPGFEGFQLLRPTAGEERYFVVTTWATEEDFKAWAAGPAKAAHSGPHGGEGKKPVASGATLLEFEVVDLEALAVGQDSE